MSRRLHVKNTFGMMIDMQEKLMPAMGHRKGASDRTLFLLKTLKELEIPVMVTQQYTRGLGNTEAAFLEAGDIKQEQIYEKITYSCMNDDTIAKTVEGMEKTNALVWGVESHICVQQTVLDLLDKGIGVYVIADCTDSRFDTDRDTAFRRMEQAGAVVTTAESVIYELMERAGTEQFRRISRLVKDAEPFAKNS